MKTRITFWRVLFVAIVLAGAYSTWVRFAHGLGAATNLSDRFPWGLWIGFDVLCGVGLAAGGFAIAATVVIFHLDRFRPILRPTVLTAFLGYVLVIVALLFDLGRPYRIWHPLVMRNPHSVMFEVAWCVMLYTAVLALEFSPVVFEKLHWERAQKIVHAISVPVVILGVLLSTLHQSSLGSLFLIMPEKLHALWYTPFLPVFFYLSALGVGLTMVILESSWSGRAFGKRIETDLLQDLARVFVVVQTVFIVWRFQDLGSRGVLGQAFSGGFTAGLFWLEVALASVVPAILFAIPAVRRSESGLFWGAAIAVTGFVLGRLNVSITGFEASSGGRYIPSWTEVAVTASIVAVGFALFGFVARRFPVFGVHESKLRRLRRGWAAHVEPV
jgi:Ni/Fe-hydrogenase subunit HybB-like protein